jgi:hypothetical protein
MGALRRGQGQGQGVSPSGVHFNERPQFALFRGRYFSAFSRFFILLLDFSFFCWIFHSFAGFFILLLDFSFFCWIFHFFRGRFSQFRHFPDEERRPR